MNLVTIRRGEGVFVPAGVLHAYLEGLGVEIMAASDNVLRGGLTPKHIDVPELLRCSTRHRGPRPSCVPRQVGDGVFRYCHRRSRFRPVRAVVDATASATVPIGGVAIVVATAGAVTVSGGSGASVELTPGRAVVVTPDEERVRMSGEGEVFIAQPGVDPRLPYPRS